MKISENKALTEARNRLNGIKKELEETELKLKLEGQRSANWNDDHAAIQARIEGRFSAKNPIREEVASLIEDVKILNLCRVELGERIAVLKEAAETQVRSSFLDKYRSILKERAALSEKLLGVLDKELQLYGEIEQAGAPATFHCSDSSMPSALAGHLEMWLQKYTAHKFENKQ